MGWSIICVQPPLWSNREMAACVLANIEGGRTFQYTAAACCYCFHLKNCTLSHLEFHIAFFLCIPSNPIWQKSLCDNLKLYTFSCLVMLCRKCAKVFLCFSNSTKSVTITMVWSGKWCSPPCWIMDCFTVGAVPIQSPQAPTLAILFKDNFISFL